MDIVHIWEPKVWCFCVWILVAPDPSTQLTMAQILEFQAENRNIKATRSTGGNISQQEDLVDIHKSDRNSWLIRIIELAEVRLLIPLILTISSGYLNPQVGWLKASWVGNPLSSPLHPGPTITYSNIIVTINNICSNQDHRSGTVL